MLVHLIAIWIIINAFLTDQRWWQIENVKGFFHNQKKKRNITIFIFEKRFCSCYCNNFFISLEIETNWIFHNYFCLYLEILDNILVTVKIRLSYSKSTFDYISQTSCIMKGIFICIILQFWINTANLITPSHPFKRKKNPKSYWSEKLLYLIQ